MNSIKLIVKSLDHLYPKGYEIPASLDDVEDAELQDETYSPDLTPEQSPSPGASSPASSSLGFIHNLVSSIFDTLIFIPNYLIIKPVVFAWLLLTYPFAYSFQQLGLTKSYDTVESDHSFMFDDEKKPDTDEEKKASLSDDEEIKPILSRPSTPSHTTRSLKFAVDPKKSRTNMSGIDEKTELLKQENIIANSIKSPTASSKYIIPPPQRLYPLSRNPNKKRRKTLILDLDETLIHSLSRGSPRSFNSSSSSDPKVIEIKLQNMASLYYVHKRPYCDFFLKEISKWFELQIFTASVKEYADPIIDWLENEIIDHRKADKDDKQIPTAAPKIFTKRYYRTDCTYRQGVGYIKDLSKFYPKEEELKNVIILDNSPVSYALHEDNAVMIEGWINDQSDRDLLNLLPMLHSLSLCIDVRFILGLRGGEKVFES